MDECSSDFRNQWWQIDPEILIELNIDDLCIHLDDNGTLEVTNFAGSWNKEYIVDCVVSPENDSDFYHIHKHGNALISSIDEDKWSMDFNFKSGLVKGNTLLYECPWF